MSRARRLSSKYKKAVQARKAKIVRATCEQCGGEYTQAEAATIRPVQFEEDVEEIGIQCPHCEHWTHAYFMTAELRELKSRVDALEKEWQREGNREIGLRYVAIQKRFLTTFKAVNRELRSLAGVLSPHDILAEQQGEHG